MTFWILLFVIPIITFAIVEELIYFSVNRSVFGPSRIEIKLTLWFQKLYKK